MCGRIQRHVYVLRWITMLPSEIIPCLTKQWNNLFSTNFLDITYCQNTKINWKHHLPWEWLFGDSEPARRIKDQQIWRRQRRFDTAVRAPALHEFKELRLSMNGVCGYPWHGSWQMSLGWTSLLAMTSSPLTSDVVPRMRHLPSRISRKPSVVRVKPKTRHKTCPWWFSNQKPKL